MDLTTNCASAGWLSCTAGCDPAAHERANYVTILQSWKTRGSAVM